MSAVTPEEEDTGREITPEEENYIRDEGLALQLLRDFLHVPTPDMKDGELVLIGGKATEDEARRALCRNLRNEKWGPSSDVLDALIAAFDPDAKNSALKAILKRRSKGHTNRYADIVIAEAMSQLRFAGKHYEDAAVEVAML